MVRPHAHWFQDIHVQTHAARLGMWIFLGSETLLFGGLFALYAAYHAMYPQAFAKAGAHSDLVLGTLNTYILITSSATMAFSLHATRSNSPKRALGLLVCTMLLGSTFLVIKGIEYQEHFHHGIYPGAHYEFADLPENGARMYFTLYFFMTGMHALHVLGGLVVLGWLAIQTHRRHLSQQSHLAHELGGMYWHLVDVVWLFLWPLFYLVN